MPPAKSNNGDGVRPIPHNEHAEMALLGALIDAGETQPDQFGFAITELRGPDDLLKPKHAMLCRAMIDLYERHGRFSPALLVTTLQQRSELETLGGESYLQQLMESGYGYEAVRYAEQVASMAKHLRFCSVLDRLRDKADRNGTETRELLDEAMVELAGAVEHRRTGGRQRHELMREYAERLRSNDQKLKIRTGFYKLDQMIGGMKQGDLVFLGARPSMGKSAFLARMCEHASEAGEASVLVTLEMDHADFGKRFIAGNTGIDAAKIDTTRDGDPEMQRIDHSIEHVKELDESGAVWVEHRPGLTLGSLRVIARRYVDGLGCKMVVVDYLNLMRCQSAENRTNEMRELANGLKQLAGELGVPVVVGAQLNRDVEHRESKRPRMSDLRDGGALEEAADVVLLLHRSGYWLTGEDAKGTDASRPEEAEVIVSKGRNAQTGVAKVFFQRNITRFFNPIIEEPME